MPSEEKEGYRSHRPTYVVHRASNQWCNRGHRRKKRGGQGRSGPVFGAIMLNSEEAQKFFSPRRAGTRRE